MFTYIRMAIIAYQYPQQITGRLIYLLLQYTPRRLILCTSLGPNLVQCRLVIKSHTLWKSICSCLD